MNLLISSMLFFAFCSCPFPTARADVQRSRVLHYSTKQTVSVNEPVIVEVRIHNTFQRDLKVDLGTNYKGAFRIVITDPTGRRHLLPRLVERSEGISTPGLFTLEPDLVYTGRLVLNEWYAFSKLGTYLVDLEMTGSLQIQGVELPNERGAFRAAVTVIARDPKRLKQVSEELVETALRAGSYVDTADYALALSHLTDPVAVPFLARLLESGRVEQIAIDGLRRIGNKEAVDILIATFESKNEEAVIFAQRALRRLASETNNALIKRQIQQAIK